MGTELTFPLKSRLWKVGGKGKYYHPLLSQLPQSSHWVGTLTHGLVVVGDSTSRCLGMLDGYHAFFGLSVPVTQERVKGVILRATLGHMQMDAYCVHSSMDLGGRLLWDIHRWVPIACMAWGWREPSYGFLCQAWAWQGVLFWTYTDGCLLCAQLCGTGKEACPVCMQMGT